jgi:hypothetical protein
MNIEYFSGTATNQPVVLIYGREPTGFVLLRRAARELTNGLARRVAIHDLPGFEPVEGCELFFSLGARDLGLHPISPPNSFDCEVGSIWWENIEGLLEPFTRPLERVRFQSLTYGFSSPVDLVVSTSRQW